MKWLVMSGIFAIALLFYMIYVARLNRTITHELFFSELPPSFDGMRLFFISDIHYRIIDDGLIHAIKGQVDLVAIGGDLMESGVPFHRVEQNIRKLTALAPVYFVWGNNDYEADPAQLEQLLHRLGVTILANESIQLNRNGQFLSLVGVEDVGYRRDRLDIALQQSKGFRLLICHNPNIVRKIRREHKIALVLSGHTHGGQIRLFGFGIREKGKLKQVANTTVLISNGYGTTRLPLRLGAYPETHYIILRTKQS